MFNVFEQPWTLLIAAIIALIIMVEVHTFKHDWWLWILQLVFFAACFVFEFIHHPDAAKIQGVLGLAIVILFIIRVVRAMLLTKRYQWQWFLPVCLAAAAFALDAFVETDLEKINTLISTGVKAVEDENPDAVEPIISEDYSDSYHKTKTALMRHCRRKLSEPLVEKNIKRIVEIVVSPSKTTAEATFTVRMVFDKRSYVYRNYKRTMLLRVKANLQKEQGKWLINQAELLELDMQPFDWRHVR